MKEVSKLIAIHLWEIEGLGWVGFGFCPLKEVTSLFFNLVS